MRRPLIALLLLALACSTLKEAAGVGGDAATALSDAGADPETMDASALGPADASSDAADKGCSPTCAAPKICVDGDAGSRCIVPTIRWFVDGALVAEYATHEALYTASSSDPYFIAFPHYGRSIQISLPAAVGTGNVLSCPSSGPVRLGLLTTDNGYAGLSALPARWKGLVFAECGMQIGGDQVTARDVTLTAAPNPGRVVGTYEVIVQGAGPRAGSTLRVTGVFDVAPLEP